MSSQYFLTFHTNASSLITFAQHPSLYYKEYILNEKKLPSNIMKIGSVVHALVMNQSLTIKVYKAPIPTGQMLIFCDYIIRNIGIVQTESLVLNLALKQAAYIAAEVKRDSFEKFCTRFDAEGLPYVIEQLQSLKEEDNTYYLTAEDYTNCMTYASSISNSDCFSKILNSENTIIYEKELYWRQYDLYDLKAKPDILVIDSVNETITIIDLKLKSMPIEKFPFEFIKRKLYIQAVFQFWGVSNWITTQEFIEQYGSNYTVNPPQYLVYSIPKDDVALFEMGWEDLIFAVSGGEIPNGSRIKGVLTLLEDLQWHIAENYWKREKSFYVADGSILLDAFTHNTLNYENQSDMESKI